MTQPTVLPGKHNTGNTGTMKYDARSAWLTRAARASSAGCRERALQIIYNVGVTSIHVPALACRPTTLLLWLQSPRWHYRTWYCIAGCVCVLASYASLWLYSWWRLWSLMKIRVVSKLQNWRRQCPLRELIIVSRIHFCSVFDAINMGVLPFTPEEL